MVLKKTNWEAINSGNTLKKRYYRHVHRKYAARKSHVAKYVHHMKMTIPWDGSYAEVDTAQNYIDDGDLEPSTGYHELVYSLNKRKRWLLDLNVGSAVFNKYLAEEAFKVTLVHRHTPCSGRVKSCLKNYRNTFCNVTHYHDSHGTRPNVTAWVNYSTRHDLAYKAALKERGPKDSLKCRKNRPGHNQHFRDLQRKTVRPRKIDSRMMTDDDIITLVPEIRYEVEETMPVNSTSFRSWAHCPDIAKPSGTRFRGSHREHVEWYFEDSLICEESFASNRQQPDYASVFITAGTSVDGEDEDDTERLWSPPQNQVYSLWELAQATKLRHSQKPKRTGPTTTTTTKREKHAICSASSRTVNKYGKRAAVFIEQEQKQDEEDFADLVESDEDSGLHSNEDSDPSSLENVAFPTVDYEKEFARFDESFSSCVIPDEELNMTDLQDRYAGEVEFARCVPLTLKVDLQAVWEAGHRGTEGEEHVEGGGELEGWVLLCQRGEVLDSGWTAGGHDRDASQVKLRVFGSHKEEEVAAVNNELTHVMTGEDGQPRLLSLDTLLNRVCSVVRQKSVSRGSKPLGGSKEAVSHSKHRPLEGFLPPTRYTDKVEVCSMNEAYLRLQSAKKHVPSQTTKSDELDISSDLQCSICFTLLEDMGTSRQGFSSFVAMTTCGHSFCRQCWQRHLVSSIEGGNAMLHCMTCESTVDSATVMSLVPQWVYNRWQQRLQSQTVEMSGEWRWCPNARCGRVARTSGSRHNGKPEDTQGTPVACLCHTRWCLDCGQGAHWPIKCAQFSAYTKQLRQNGEEDGVKTTHLEITSVQVKRCPFCRYPIEKNGGCSHMSCSQCRNQFCWVCLVDWTVHTSGNWQGCPEKAVETISLENERMYPLPIECYQKAVAHRYIWKQLDREQRSKITVFRSNYVRFRHKETLHENVLDHVMDALLFLRKGHMLLELSFILLSNSPRRHQLVRLLSSNLQQLHFMCDRVDQHVKQPVKQVLQSSEHLHKITTYGNLQLDQVCLLAHSLVSKSQGSSRQTWLLQGNHEDFVRFK